MYPLIQFVRISIFFFFSVSFLLHQLVGRLLFLFVGLRVTVRAPDRVLHNKEGPSQTTGDRRRRRVTRPQGKGVHDALRCCVRRETVLVAAQSGIWQVSITQRYSTGPSHNQTTMLFACLGLRRSPLTIEHGLGKSTTRLGR